MIEALIDICCTISGELQEVCVVKLSCVGLMVR